jgi:glycosyltransferase involved in cell wall biosynthesis
VFPSLEENFPMVLLEAMTAGCAIVTTSAPGCAELVGEAGVLVPPGDVDTLRREVLALARDPARVEMLGTRARARARQFDATRVAGCYVDLFERVVRETARPSPGGSAAMSRVA